MPFSLFPGLGSRTPGVKDTPFLGSVWATKEAEEHLLPGDFVYARDLHASTLGSLGLFHSWTVIGERRRSPRVEDVPRPPSRPISNLKRGYPLLPVSVIQDTTGLDPYHGTRGTPVEALNDTIITYNDR